MKSPLQLTAAEISARFDAGLEIPPYVEIEVWSLVFPDRFIAWGAGQHAEVPRDGRHWEPGAVRRCAAAYFGCDKDDQLLWVCFDVAGKAVDARGERGERGAWIARYPDREHWGLMQAIWGDHTGRPGGCEPYEKSLNTPRGIVT